MPNFVIDKSLADERVWGWLMQQWHVDGLLYWGVNRWGNARTGVVGSRDPYKDPISFIWSDGRVCNGEASIIYPGYYPRYGLTDRNAVPVSSLRLEAQRRTRRQGVPQARDPARRRQGRSADHQDHHLVSV